MRPMLAKAEAAGVEQEAREEDRAESRRVDWLAQILNQGTNFSTHRQSRAKRLALGKSRNISISILCRCDTRKR